MASNHQALAERPGTESPSRREPALSTPRFRPPGSGKRRQLSAGQGSLRGVLWSSGSSKFMPSWRKTPNSVKRNPGREELLGSSEVEQRDSALGSLWKSLVETWKRRAALCRESGVGLGRDGKERGCVLRDSLLQPRGRHGRGTSGGVRRGRGLAFLDRGAFLLEAAETRNPLQAVRGRGHAGDWTLVRWGSGAALAGARGG